MKKSFFFQENKLLRRKQFLQTINFIELRNNAMKQTRDHNKDMQGIRTDLKIFLNIQTFSDMFRHLLGIFRSYSDIFRALCNPGIKRTCYIQNPGKFRIRGIFRTLVYSEPWHIKNQRHIHNSGIFRTWYIQNPVKHLRWSILQKQLTAIIILANLNYIHNWFSST